MWKLNFLSFGFSKKKDAWFWHPLEWEKKTDKIYSMDELRDIFGSEKVKSKPFTTIG